MHLPAKQCDLLLLPFFKTVTGYCIKSNGRPLMQHSTARYFTVSSGATFFLLHQPITSKVSVNARSIAEPSGFVSSFQLAVHIEACKIVMYHASHQKASV